MKKILISVNKNETALFDTKVFFLMKKNRPKTDEPYIVYVYETPTNKIVGEFELRHIVKQNFVDKENTYYDFELLIVSNSVNKTKKQILDYAGNKDIYLWKIDKYKEYDNFKELKELNIKKAPTNWCYVKGE